MSKYETMKMMTGKGKGDGGISTSARRALSIETLRGCVPVQFPKQAHPTERCFCSNTGTLKYLLYFTACSIIFLLLGRKLLRTIKITKWKSVHNKSLWGDSHLLLLFSNLDTARLTLVWKRRLYMHLFSITLPHRQTHSDSWPSSISPIKMY